VDAAEENPKESQKKGKSQSGLTNLGAGLLESFPGASGKSGGNPKEGGCGMKKKGGDEDRSFRKNGKLQKGGAGC